ncbi:MAG: SPFH domain-containing protein, partial [Phycisphaerae bacterium]
HYNYANPYKLVEAVAYRELALYVAGTELDNLLGADRDRAAEYLKQRIQRRLDELQVGVAVTFVGLQNIHPPRQGQVAEAFQEVIGALAEKEAAIRKAEGEENRTLAEVAGGKKLALDLVEALRQAEQLRDRQADQQQLERAQQRIRRLFNGYYTTDSAGRQRFVPGVAGQAAAIVLEARGYRWDREEEARGKAERFRQALLAYRASPRFFKLRRYLQVLSDGLKQARKYVLAADTRQLPLVVEMDVQTIPRPEVESFEPTGQP